MRIAGVLANSLDAAEYSKRCRWSHAFTQARGKRKGFMSRRVCVSEGASLRSSASPWSLLTSVRLVVGQVSAGTEELARQGEHLPRVPDYIVALWPPRAARPPLRRLLPLPLPCATLPRRLRPGPLRSAVLRRVLSGDAKLQARPRPEPFLQNLPQGLSVAGVSGLFEVKNRFFGKGDLQNPLLKSGRPPFREDGGRQNRLAVRTVPQDLAPLRVQGFEPGPLIPLISGFRSSPRLGLPRLVFFPSSPSLLFESCELGPAALREQRCDDVALGEGLLHSFKATEESVHGGLGVVAGELEEGQLELQLRLYAAFGTREAVAQSFDHAHHLGGRDSPGLLLEPRPLLGVDLVERDLGGMRQEHEAPEVCDDLAYKAREVSALVLEPLHDAQGVRRPPFVERVRCLQQYLRTRAPQELPDARGGYGAVGERGELVQETLGVPERAPAFARDRGECCRLGLYPLDLRDLAQLLRKSRDSRTPEIEALTAADNRRQDLVLLGRSQHKDYVLRWLLKHL